MGYPRRLLGDGEDLVRDLHPHGRTLVRPVLLLLLVVGAAAYGVAAAGRLAGGAAAAVPLRLVIAAVAAFLLFFWCLVPYLRWRTTHFLLTTQRVAVRAGVLSRSGRDVPLSRITDITFSRSPLDRVLGSGTLVVESAGERGQLTLTDVPSVEAVQRELYELIDDAQDRQPVPDRRTGP